MHVWLHEDKQQREQNCCTFLQPLKPFFVFQFIWDCAVSGKQNILYTYARLKKKKKKDRTLHSETCVSPSFLDCSPAKPFWSMTYLNVGLTFLLPCAAVTVTARLYCTLRFCPLWPRHFQSSRIITEAALHIPPGWKWQHRGSSRCHLRNEMQGGEPEQDRDGDRLQNAWRRRGEDVLRVFFFFLFLFIFLAAKQLMQRWK